MRNDRRRGSGGKTGLPGIGFHLTNDGHYDIKNKKLVNIHPPFNEADGVNLVYLKEHCILKDGNAFDSKGLRIKNLLEPVENNDGINLKYFDDNCITKVGNDFDAKGLVLKNLKTPTENDEGVNLGTVKENCLWGDPGKYFDAKKNRIVNLDTPKEDSDAITLKYLRDNSILLNGDSLNANGKPIYNVPDAISDDEVVNFGMLKDWITSRFITKSSSVGYQLHIDFFKMHEHGKDFMTVHNNVILVSHYVSYLKMEITFISDNPAPDETMTLKILKDFPLKPPSAKVIYSDTFKIGKRTTMAVWCYNVHIGERITFSVTPKTDDLSFDMWTVFERVL